jgi:anti-sigma B factor antagonist
VNEANPPIDGAPFELSVRDLDGTRFVTVNGEVDMSVADTLTEGLSGQRVLVDMTGVSFIDSTGLACLLVAREASETLVLRRSGPVARILELGGVSQLFPAPELRRQKPPGVLVLPRGGSVFVRGYFALLSRRGNRFPPGRGVRLTADYHGAHLLPVGEMAQTGIHRGRDRQWRLV